MTKKEVIEKAIKIYKGEIESPLRELGIHQILVALTDNPECNKKTVSSWYDFLKKKPDNCNPQERTIDVVVKSKSRGQSIMVQKKLVYWWPPEDTVSRANYLENILRIINNQNEVK